MKSVYLGIAYASAKDSLENLKLFPKRRVELVEIADRGHKGVAKGHVLPRSEPDSVCSCTGIPVSYWAAGSLSGSRWVPP